MRRALLLATVIVAPALAVAQTTGAVILEHASSRANPLTVNAAECEGGITALARWNVTLLGVYQTQGVPTNATYTIYGSNQDPNTNTPQGTCFTTDGISPSTLRAGTVLTSVSGSSGNIDLGTLVSKAGKNCLNDDTVWICVQGRDQGSANAIFGIATAAVAISTFYPAVPNINAITPGDRALNIDWGAGALAGTLVKTINVEFEATPISTAGQQVGPPVTAGKFGASPARFEKLVNDQGYKVRARAFMEADNASTFSPYFLGTPQFVNDFWDTYKAAGGRDDGGCSSGLAGPLGLGILIATLALARRRR